MYCWPKHTPSPLTYIVGGQRLTHALLNEVVGDATRGMFVEDRIHEGNLGSASSRLRLGRTELLNGGRIRQDESDTE